MGLRADDAALGTQMRGLVDAALDPGADVGRQVSAVISKHEALDERRTAFTELLNEEVDAASRANARGRSLAMVVVWSSVAAALLLLGCIFLGIRQSVPGVTRRLQHLLAQNENDAARDAFGRQVVEALDMADDEEAARTVVSRAMTQVAASLPMELLLADSSKAHLARAAEHPSAGRAPCRPPVWPGQPAHPGPRGAGAPHAPTPLRPRLRRPGPLQGAQRHLRPRGG